MAVNVNAPNFSGVASRGGILGNLTVPGELGLRSYQLGLNKQQADKQAALELMKIRQRDEMALRQAQLVRQQMAQQAQQAAAEQQFRNQQLQASTQQGLLGNQLQQRGQDMTYGLGMAQLQADKEKTEKQQYAKMYEQELKRLADKKKEDLDQMGAFAVQAKLGMEQAKDPQEANMLRNEIVDEAAEMGMIPKNQAKTLKQLTLSGFNNYLNHSIAFTDAAQKYKALKSKETGSGGLVTITRSDGSTVTVQDPAAKTKGNEQEQISKALVQLNRLEEVGNKFEENFLTVEGGLKGYYGSVAASSPTAAQYMPGSAEAKEFHGRRSAFIQDVNRFFSQWVKDMTGVQFGMKEFEMRKKEVINSSDDPVAFKAKYNALIEDMKKATKVHMDLLKEGVPVDSAEFDRKYEERIKPLLETKSKPLSEMTDEELMEAYNNAK